MVEDANPLESIDAVEFAELIGLLLDGVDATQRNGAVIILDGSTALLRAKPPEAAVLSIRPVSALAVSDSLVLSGAFDTRVILWDRERAVALRALRLHEGNVTATAFLPDGGHADYLMRTETYDAVVLDLGLPKKDGLTLITELRNVGKQVPILVLSALSQVDDSDAGVNFGWSRLEGTRCFPSGSSCSMAASTTSGARRS